jgi:hypothetical protein
MQVMNAALGGLFSSRINLNLREDKGYSYGVFSAFRYDRTPGPFVIAGSVRTDVTGPSVAEMFREVNGMRDKPLPGRRTGGRTRLAGVFAAGPVRDQQRHRGEPGRDLCLRPAGRLLAHLARPLRP